MALVLDSGNVCCAVLPISVFVRRDVSQVVVDLNSNNTQDIVNVGWLLVCLDFSVSHFRCSRTSALISVGDDNDILC